MKTRIILLVFLAIYGLSTYAQCDDCYEGIDIRTNPANPENCEIEEEFSGSTNQFKNTFDWAKRSTGTNGTFSFNTIKLNPNAGWQIPDFTNPSNPIYMQSPYYHGFLDLGGGTPLGDYDFAWEDGWELMFMNTGYFPNGDPYDDPDALGSTPIDPSPLQLHNTRVPYIMLYNRYTGKLRSFFNVFTDLGAANDVAFDLGYLAYKSNNPTNVSGIFRHVNAYDVPLDRPTTAKAFSTHFSNPNNMTQWFMTDVQLGYDPCVCDYFSQFNFNLSAIDKYDVDLLGRSIAVEQPLQDANGNPSYTDFLNVNNGVGQNVNPDGSGLLIYKTLEDMLDNYENEIQAYKDELEDYNSLGNVAMRNLMSLAKTGLNTSLKGLVPSYILKDLSKNAVRVVTKTFDKKNYESAEQWYKDVNSPPSAPTWLTASSASKPEGQEAYEQMVADAKKYSNELSKTLKGGIGTLSDAVFSSFYTALAKPVKPSMPTATFTEMKIKGTISKSSPIEVGALYTPGSYKFGGSFDRSAYPVYNQPVGLFALLETPELSAFEEVKDTSIFLAPPGQFMDDWVIRMESNAKLYLKLKSPLKYRFNHAVDFDFNKTQVYAQVQVTYNPQKQEGNTIAKQNGNLKVLQEMENVLTVSSDWYPVEMLGENLLGIELQNFQEGVHSFVDVATLSLEKITFKLMVDMYFESPGFDGYEKNTTQVFTYLMYDKDENIDFIAEKGEWLTDPASISKYALGTLVLENEEIEPTDDFVSEVIGTDIYINAEQIELKGNISVANGYKAKLQSYWGFEMNPTTQLTPAIELAIKRDFYNFPATTEVTNTELAAYCKGNTKKYQANAVLNKKEPEVVEDRIQVGNPTEFTLRPNPTLNWVEAIWQAEENITEVRVFNMMGQTVWSKPLDPNQSSVQIDLSNEAKGVYVVMILQGNKRKGQQKVVKF